MIQIVPLECALTSRAANSATMAFQLHGMGSVLLNAPRIINGSVENAFLQGNVRRANISTDGGNVKNAIRIAPLKCALTSRDASNAMLASQLPPAGHASRRVCQIKSW